jgi:hypothetical protein
MQNTQTLTLSNRKYTYSILDSIETQIEITDNPYQLPVDDLFTMAARINKKRSFLFVSKLLGKHLPIVPAKGLFTGALLAARYVEETVKITVPEKERLLFSFLMNEPKIDIIPFVPENINPVIIGFAETATALGHAFFSCFKHADFFHTTREELIGQSSIITFEEEHSHATAHRCYIPEAMIKNEREIILVDDELTTGKTALNIIQSIHQNFPRKQYTIVSILDWRSKEDKQAVKHLEKHLGVFIKVVSLVRGNVAVKQIKDIEPGTGKNSAESHVPIEVLSLSSFFYAANYTKVSSMKVPYIKETGRFGLSSLENQTLQQNISKAASFLKEKREGRMTLCLGTGEFMYLPMKIASEMGSNIFYQSTTRSPIYIRDREGYGARTGILFPNPEDKAIVNFVYNIQPGQYDELFLFFEREIEMNKLKPLIMELDQLKFQTIKLVFFSGSES